MNPFDALKDELLRDIADDRRAWTLTTVPPIVGIALICLMLSVISVYGLYLSVVSIKEVKDVSSLAKAAQIFVGGSASVLGFVVIRLLSKLGEMIASYVFERKRFTGYIGKIKLASSKALLTQVLDDYGRH